MSPLVTHSLRPHFGFSIGLRGAVANNQDQDYLDLAHLFAQLSAERIRRGSRNAPSQIVVGKRRDRRDENKCQILI